MVYRGIHSPKPYRGPLNARRQLQKEGVGSDTMFERGIFSRSPGKSVTPLEDFVRRYGKDTTRELLDGTGVERMDVSIEHEKLRYWLSRLLEDYVKGMRSGLLLDANTLVAVNDRRARRPDLLFLSDNCRELLKGNIVYGAPDLVIEIVSSYDLASELTSRENDYRAISVPEIAFLDPVKRQARLLRLRGHEYETEMLLDAGTLHFAMLFGIGIPMSALMYEPRPPVEELARKLLQP